MVKPSTSIRSFREVLSTCFGYVVNLDNRILARRDRYILSFHRVLEPREAKKDGMHHSLWISPQGLASLIRWMLEVGDIVDYSRIVNCEPQYHKPLFALTFDDGWKDTYTNAFPIIKEYGVPAIVFLVTAATESGVLLWPQDITTKTVRLLRMGKDAEVRAALLSGWPEDEKRASSKMPITLKTVEEWIELLKRVRQDERERRIEDYFQRLGVSNISLKGYIMDWEDARKMQKHGIRFGSHTHNHTITENLPAAQIEEEVRHSKALISEKLQAEVDCFCYPNARYSGKEGSILEKCGYRYGFRLDNMSLRHCSDNFYIPRFIVSESCARNPSYFKMRLLQAPLYRSKPHNPHRNQS